MYNLHNPHTNNLHTKIKKSLPKQTFFWSGGKRIRTADPLHAMQVLYQLSYTPLDEDQCNISLKKVSRTKPRLKYNFLIFVPLLISLLSFSGCEANKKKAGQQNTLQQDFQLAQVIQALDGPPLGQETYTPTSQNYKILDTFKSNDKRKNSHRHYYVYSNGLPTIDTLESLMQSNPENVHWIYLTQQDSTLERSGPEAFNSFAYCIRQALVNSGLSTQRSFKSVYVYRGSTFHCELSYLP